MAEDGSDDKIIATISKTVEIEQSVEETLPIGGGSTLVRRQENYTVNVQAVTPEMAELHRELTRMQCESQERIAKTNADAEVKISDNKHVAPVKAMLRPVWLMVTILGAGGFVSLWLGKDQVAIVCFSGLAVTAIVGAVLDRLKKPPEK